MNNQIKQLLEKWSASINEKKYRETAQCYEPLTCNALMRQADKPMENEGVYNIETIRFLYNGIIIKHQKTEPTYTKTSLFLCEKRRFLWPGLRKEGNLFKLAGPGGLAFFHLTKKEVSKWPMKR